MHFMEVSRLQVLGGNSITNELLWQKSQSLSEETTIKILPQRMDPCLCMAESILCSPKTITTLFISYTPMQNKKLKKLKTECLQLKKKKDSSPKEKATRTTIFVKNINYYVYQTGGLISVQWELNVSLAREFGNRCNRLRNLKFPFTEWLYYTWMVEMTPKIKSSGVKETRLN